ncbi:hypothetical protein ID866_7756 [Astraeus odoratus]|nr:hypothetical protein ID866_7756 [Astraeus odoratus]
MTISPFDHGTQTKVTEPPNNSWSFCKKLESTAHGRKWLEGEEQGWKVVNTDEEDKMSVYKLMVSGVVPRPIAFVSTVSETGVENLAPFSWFNMVTYDPPLISFSCRHSPRIKDTPTNAKNGLGFTVNIISEPFVENANSTSIDAPPEFNEWEISGLTKAPSIHVKAPRVKESAFSMECEAIDIIHPDSGVCTTTMILALVKYIHVRKDVLNERELVDITKFKPVARLGGIAYGRVGDTFGLARPAWDEDNIARALDSLKIDEKS